MCTVPVPIVKKYCHIQIVAFFMCEKVLRKMSGVTRPGNMSLRKTVFVRTQWSERDFLKMPLRLHYIGKEI